MTWRAWVNDERGTHTPSPRFRRRRDAEAFAARRSAFREGFVIVKRDGFPEWVSAYRNGYLHDAQDRRAIEGAPREPFERTKRELTADWFRWLVIKGAS